MNSQDDLLKDFSDVTSRIKSEFKTLDSVAPSRKKVLKKKPFVLVAAAATIAVTLVVSPSLTGASDVNQPAWAAVPTKLTEKEKEEIKKVCLGNDLPEKYEVVIVDERSERGFIVLKGEMLVSDEFDESPMPGVDLDSKMYQDVVCAYKRTFSGFSTKGVFSVMSNVSTRGTGWGPDKLGKTKVWFIHSGVGSNVVRVEIQTAQGLVFDASLANGVFFAWWPRLEEAHADATGKTNALARFYDKDGNLVKTFSLLTGDFYKGEKMIPLN
ncbi:MAG: hypothetical protein RLZZ330_361 [Actinomycetota bacterium]|jgi:hypothetical protein